MEGRQKYRLVPGEGVCYNGGNRKKNGGGAAVKKKTAKTNVMRQLDRRKSPMRYGSTPTRRGWRWTGSPWPVPGPGAGQRVQTLVTRGASGGYYVFDVPVDGELDLKKAARAVGEKSVAMLHVAELLPLTGYVRGGCSPVGMKKQFPTVFHDSARHYDRIAVSAGKIGLQVLGGPRRSLPPGGRPVRGCHQVNQAEQKAKTSRSRRGERDAFFLYLFSEKFMI